MCLHGHTGARQVRCTEMGGAVSKKLHVQSQGHPGRPGTWSEGCLHWRCPWALGTLKFPSSSQTSESLWNDFLDREQRSGKTRITRWSTTSKKWRGPPRAPRPAHLSAGKGLGNTCAEKMPGASQHRKDPPEAAASGTSLHTQHRHAGLIPGRRAPRHGQVRHGRWDSQQDHPGGRAG